MKNLPFFDAGDGGLAENSLLCEFLLPLAAAWGDGEGEDLWPLCCAACVVDQICCGHEEVLLGWSSIFTTMRGHRSWRL